MTNEQEKPYDKLAFQVQYEKWIADQITDEVFYDYLNENAIPMGDVLDLANDRKRLSEVKPGDDIVYTTPPSGLALDQCLKCHRAVMQASEIPGAPLTWLHVDADRDYDHLAKVLQPMTVNDITGLVANNKAPVVKNSGHKWDDLDQVARYKVLRGARDETDPDYPPENKFVPGHAEDLRRALDVTGGPIEQKD
jgi:hypothetical protein